MGYRRKDFFENDHCLMWASSLGFDEWSKCGATLDARARDEAGCRRVGLARGHVYAYWADGEHGICNCLMSDGRRETPCRDAPLDLAIANPSLPGNLQAWRDVDHAKNRLLCSRARLDVPFDDSADGAGRRRSTSPSIR